jgi:Ala-tRNA(Pro) deacylase
VVVGSAPGDARRVQSKQAAPISFTVRLPSGVDARRLTLEGADLHRRRHAVLALRDLTSHLDAQDLLYDILHHARATTAVSEARVLHIPPGDVAKTVIFIAPQGCVRAVVPANAHVDVRRLQELLEEYSLTLASEADLANLFPEFELGAIPPFGGARRDLTVVDSSLLRRKAIVIEAGTQQDSLRLSPRDLVRVSEARIADIRRDD